jgi:hypothetical protein
VADAEKLRWSLKTLGLSDHAINAAWPEWWSDSADASASARAELRFSLARKLGLDPQSLFDMGEPKFIWKDEAKFKRLTTETSTERAALVSFGASIGRALIAATPPGPSIMGISPHLLRESILKSQRFIRLTDLLGLCWAMGIPVIHLRVFPLPAKRMSAMIVKTADRFSILLARDANYPAPIAFYLAHELGHAALGHVSDDVALVDFGEAMEASGEDEEEAAADRFALEVLTGMSRPIVLPEASGYSAAALADSALRASNDLRIEPGTLALCLGYTTSAWEKVYAALKSIYTQEQPVWKHVNRVAFKELDWSALNDDLATYLVAVMGGEPRDFRR